jgi:hypothetical protein
VLPPARCGASPRPRRAPRLTLLPRSSPSILAVAAGMVGGLSAVLGCSLLSSAPACDLGPGPEEATKPPARQLPEPRPEAGSRIVGKEQGRPAEVLAQAGVFLIHASTVRFRELDAKFLLRGRPGFSTRRDPNRRGAAPPRGLRGSSAAGWPRCAAPRLSACRWRPQRGVLARKRPPDVRLLRPPGWAVRS